MGPLRERAENGLGQIEDSIVSLLEQHPDGLTNAQIAKALGIETGNSGEHRNMLSWSVISRLIRAGRIERVQAKRSVVLRVPRE